MSKAKNVYICGECGLKSLKWLGRCPECQNWNSFTEELKAAKKSGAPSRPPAKVCTLDQVPKDSLIRLKTGLNELDRVLGGGLAPASVVLLAGEPGIGKSTLMLQAAAGLAENGGQLLYITGEESIAQVRLRAERLMLPLEKLSVAAETEVEAILELAHSHPWDVLVIDSVQTLSSTESSSPPGSLNQIRASAAALAGLAKTVGKPVWLVGHITKDGAIAGPKVLEHLVDTVLYFEGERSHNLRLLRAFKNRYGSVNEIGVFEMAEKGLGEISNPSALFLAERPLEAAGSVVAPILEGQRPLLVEIQALVSTSPLPIPRRQTLGVDSARVSLLTAVLEKKAGLRLYDHDVFVNVAGGAKVVEPAADLAIVAAIASSRKDRPLDAKTVFWGEVGLAGEVRGVPRPEARLHEAFKMGFRQAVMPKAEAERFKDGPLKVLGVANIGEIIKWLSLKKPAAK